MSADVLSLIPNRALCVDLKQLGSMVREVGDRIEAGELGSVERVVILFETPDLVDRLTYGRPTTAMELVGLLEYAKNSVLNPSPAPNEG